MVLTRRILFLFFTLICFAAAMPSPALCAAQQERYIKLIDVDAQNINLDVDGKKVSIPLPDGYEVMPEQEYPNVFQKIKEQTKESKFFHICALINSTDYEKHKKGKDKSQYRVAFFEIDHDYFPHRFTESEFEKEIVHIKLLNMDLQTWLNETLLKEGKPPFSFKYIYEDKKTLSSLTVERSLRENKKFRSGRTLTEFLVEDIAIVCRFYDDITTQADIDRLTKTTLEYIKKLGTK